MITPNMDQLAKESVAFDHAFCCGATCVASRAAFYTGLFAHNTGVYHFDQWTHHRTWLDLFREEGYHLAGVGKMHHHPDESAKMAFHERVIAENFPMMTDWDDYSNYLKAENQPHPLRELTKDGNWASKCASDAFPLEEKYHMDHFIGNMSCRWLEDYDGTKPFFLHIGFHGPHDPFDPPQRMLDLYENVEVPEPVQGQGELDSKPPQYKRFLERHQQAHIDNTKPPQYGAGLMSLKGKSTPDMLRWRKHYYAKISYIDEWVGKILKQLEEKGLSDNTAIVFTSDHGENLGDHGMIYKWLMTEQSTRVPMLIKLPKGMTTPRVDHDLFTQMDIGPTLLDLAQIEVPSYLDGKSNLSRLIHNDGHHVPQRVYCEDNYLTMVRTKEKRMVHYAGQPYGEYYDILQDPWEQNNVYDNPEYEEEIKKLKLEFLEERAVSSYLGSIERVKAPVYQKRKWPEFFPNDPYVLAGPPRS
jgi:arylsulfatase A-like enzyme